MSSLAILLGIIVVVGLYVAGIYNSLISKRIGTENSYSQIDVQMKRRHDLIPNLVETVKGYAKHEQVTLEKVIQARNSAITSSAGGDINAVAQAEGQLTGALRQVFALAESYPDLKANQNFLSLQEELATTETKLEQARAVYNDSVGSYNTTVEQFPSNIIANYFKFIKKQFFELDASEAAVARQAPKISF